MLLSFLVGKKSGINNIKNNMMKKLGMSILRKLRLIKLADKIRFYILFIKTFKSRRDFKRINPDVKLPPAFYLYETFNIDYNSYHIKSIDTAKWLSSLFSKYKSLENLKVLDWGCGPGRVIRHLPNFMGESCQFYGTDYNKKYIKWCRKNITNVTFSFNQLYPPLPFENKTFDIIYGISIFTHLSLKMHFEWFNELMRILKPNGIILITLQSNAFIDKLTSEEKVIYEKGDLVVRSRTKEGHRTFSAFQPTIFVEKMLGANKILDHIEGKKVDNKPQQDVWIIQKLSN